MSLFSKSSVKNLSPAEAKGKMAAEAGGFVLLDVRTPAEFRTGYIKGALLIPLDQLEARAAADLPDKKKPIYVYCQSGMRSAAAARTLDKMGYETVYNIGGIMNWPFEIVRG